jgi:histidyl-tRNA synthetase
LRKSGINVLTGFETRSLGKQLQYADKLGILLCVIIGSDEYTTGMCSIKTLETGEQVSVLLDDLTEEVMKRLE